jgi:hypothetical protein
MAVIPNTNSFSLQDVVDVISPSSNDLYECFQDAIAECFDPNYEGDKNELNDFRNYDDSYLSDWKGYIQIFVVSVDSTTIYFECDNVSLARDDQSQSFNWEARLSGSPVDSGSVSSGTLDHGESSYPTDSWSDPSYDSIWAQVAGGSWHQIM